MSHGNARIAGRGDLPLLLDLYRHLHKSDLPPPPQRRLEAIWEGMLSVPGLHCWVVEAEGRFVSSCTISIVPNLTRGGRPYALLENIVTRRECRRQGLGKAVVSHALTHAWEAGCYKVMLLTGSRTPGVHSFYKACGFSDDDKMGYVARPPDGAA